MSEYDHDVIGVGNPSHPYNQKETELSELEQLQETYADSQRQLKYCKKLLEEMREIESDPKFVISASDQSKVDKYLSLKEALFYRIKNKI